MKSYQLYISEKFAKKSRPRSFQVRVAWRAESWNTVESQYRYRYLHKSTAEETLITLVSWFRQHEHVKNSTCGRLFIDCLFWQILPSPRLSAGPAYMKRLQFVILPYFHLHARYFHKPCGNRHGFTPLLCIVASPRRIETEGGSEEGKRGWSKEVEKKEKKEKEKKRKEAIKRRKRRRLSTWEGVHGHPLKELWNLSWLECKPRRHRCVTENSLCRIVTVSRVMAANGCREMERSLCERNALPSFLSFACLTFYISHHLKFFSTAFSAVQFNSPRIAYFSESG